MTDRIILKTLKRRARARRQNPTRSESLLWSRLRRQKLGVKFRRQHILHPFIVDFHCVSSKLSVEVDGAYHDPHADVRREHMLRSRHGVDVLRFSAQDVESDTDAVVHAIRERLRAIGG